MQINTVLVINNCPNMTCIFLQPMERVETVCAHMQDYPPELYLTGENLMFEYDPGTDYSQRFS